MHYVIGDIHGQLPALKALVEDKIKYNPETDVLYFLGDYTDWGCDGIGTLQYVMDLESGNSNVFAILGNHDLMMRQTISDPQLISDTLYGQSAWKRNCGDVTLRDYQKLSEFEQIKIKKWLADRPIEIRVEVYDRIYVLCHGAPLSAVKYLGWKNFVENGVPEPSEEQYIHDAVWYRMKPGEGLCSLVPSLKDCYIVRGHSITESRRVEAWDDEVINIDTGAKVFCPLLDDENWDEGNWKGDFQPALTAFCLEDESVLCVNLDEFRKMAEKDLVKHYTREERERKKQ